MATFTGQKGYLTWPKERGGGAGTQVAEGLKLRLRPVTPSSCCPHLRPCGHRARDLQGTQALYRHENEFIREGYCVQAADEGLSQLQY